MAPTKKATNPRSKRSTNKETDEVTDTATAEAPTEETPQAEIATEAPATESQTLSGQSEIKPEDALFDAIVEFSKDSDKPKLQEVYRSVHASSRGKAQGLAMKRAMTEANVDMEVLGDVLDAFNNLPATKSAGRTRPKVDDATANAIRLAGCMVGFELLRAEVGEDVFTTASEWFAAEAPDEHQNSVLKVAENIVKASAKGVRTTAGGRSSMKEKLTDLVSRGALTPGQTLKGANDVTATVTAEGKLETVDPKDGETKSFDSPSAAARVHRMKEDGTPTSTNGWDFWQVEVEDGKLVSVGDLRTS